MRGTFGGRSSVASGAGLLALPTPLAVAQVGPPPCHCDGVARHGVNHGTDYTFIGTGGWGDDVTADADVDSHGALCSNNMTVETTMGVRLSEGDFLFGPDQHGLVGPTLGFWYVAARQFGNRRPFNSRGYVAFLRLQEWRDVDYIAHGTAEFHWWYDVHLWKSTNDPPDYDYELATTLVYSDPDFLTAPSSPWMAQDTNPEAGDVLSLEANGTSLTVRYNGATVLTATDSSLPASGLYDDGFGEFFWGDWASFEIRDPSSHGGSCSVGNFTATAICA